MRLRNVLATMVLATGCGSNHQFFAVGGDGGGNPPADGGTPGGGPDLAQPPAMYPPGPYGNAIGKTLPDHTIQGYRLTRAQTDSTQLKIASIALHEYHDNPRCKCMLITVGAVWCGACQQEQPALVRDAAADNNFCVLGILQEGAAQQSKATPSDLDAWTQNFQQNFFTAMGDVTTNHYFDGYAKNNTIGLPFNLVVTPADMKVVDSWQGFDPNTHSHAMASCGM